MRCIHSCDLPFLSFSRLSCLSVSFSNPIDLDVPFTSFRFTEWVMMTDRPMIAKLRPPRLQEDQFTFISTFSFPFYFWKKIFWFHDYLSLLYESIVSTFQHSSLDLHHPFMFSPRCNRIPYFRFLLPTFILLASVVNQDSAWSRSGNETEKEKERTTSREEWWLFRKLNMFIPFSWKMVIVEMKKFQ